MMFTTQDLEYPRLDVSDITGTHAFGVYQCIDTFWATTLRDNTTDAVGAKLLSRIVVLSPESGMPRCHHGYQPKECVVACCYP